MTIFKRSLLNPAEQRAILEFALFMGGKSCAKRAGDGLPKIGRCLQRKQA